MSVGLSKSMIEQWVLNELHNNLTPHSIARAIAVAIDKNNKEIEKQLSLKPKI
jgi:hypothetical protein